MKKLLYLLLFYCLISCNKYVHPTQEIPNCELCNLAENLNGTYRGYASGILVLTPTGNFDSLTMTIQQIYLENSQFEDSTFMHFYATYKYDSSELKYDTIRIKNKAGTVNSNHDLFSIPSTGGRVSFNLNPDSIYINAKISDPFGGENNGILATLYKQ